MNEDTIFSSEYSNELNKTDSKESSEELTEVKIESKMYGINKPSRVIIKGKITHGEDSEN